MLTRARPSDPPPPTTKSTPKRPRPNHPPPPLNKDVDDLGSIGSLDSHEPDELDKEEEQMLQLSALQDASSALRDLALEKAAAESKTKIEILTKDEEGRVVVDTVQAMVDKSTEEMTAHEMDQFISSLPIDNLFKTFDLDGSGAIDFDEFSKMLPQINIHIPEAQALKFFAACDSDGSGEIDQEEFCVCLIAATNAVNRGSNNENHTVLTPLDAFQLFDEDGSNSIDFTEFNALCDYCGLSHINEKQRKKNFKRFDEDGGGTLDFEEFKLTWILMTDPFQQAKAHQLPLHRFDTKAEVREKVMRYLEKIEEIDEVSMVDAQRWVDFHHEKMNREREERDKLITSREYWRDLPSDQWSLRLMVESLNKLGYDTGGKKEVLEHRIRSYVRDPLIMSEWLWILVEAVLKMTDKGFESWGGVYTCGHGTNGQLGRPCDTRTSELSGRVVKHTYGETLSLIKAPVEKGELWEGPPLHLGRIGIDSTTYNSKSKLPLGGRSIFEGKMDKEDLKAERELMESLNPQLNSSQTFQSIESLASKGIDQIFTSFCSEIAFVHTTATGELWMLGGIKGSKDHGGREYAIPVPEPEKEKESLAGRIYAKKVRKNVGLPYNEFNVPYKIDCFEDQKVLSMGLGRSHALAVLETTDLYCWGSNSHGQLGLIGSTRLNEGATNPTRDTVLIKIPQRKGGSIVTTADQFMKDNELQDRNETDPEEAAQREEDYLRRPGGPIAPNGSQTRSIDISRGTVVRHSGGGRTIVKDLGGRRTFFWDNESYLKEADQPMPVILDGIVGKGLQSSSVSCGPTHSVAIASGRIYTWGAGPESNLGRSLKDRKQLGTPWSSHDPTPEQIEMPRGLLRVPMRLVAAGASHSVAISFDGRLFSWGNTDGGRRKIPEVNSQEEPENDDEGYDDRHSEGGRIVETSLNSGGSSVLLSSLPSFSSSVAFGSRTSTNRLSSMNASTASSSIRGNSRSRVNVDDDDDSSVLPNAKRVIPSYSPRQVDLDDRKCYAAACGSWHTVIIVEVNNTDFNGAVSRAQSIQTSTTGGRDPVRGTDQVGVVWTWGNGRFGQLGRGMSPKEQSFNDPRPVTILGGHGFGRYSNEDHSAGILTRKISCGSNHTAALTAAGTLWTWGYNRHGCLGRKSRLPYKCESPRKAPGRDSIPTQVTHSGVGSINNYLKKKINPEHQELIGGIPRLVTDLTGFPKGRVLDVGCGPDFTIVCTAPWTGIGPMQIRELEDCAVRVIQSVSRKFLIKLKAIRRSKCEYTKIWHLQNKKYYYRHNITGEKTFHMPKCFGGDDLNVKVIQNTQVIPSIQNHAEDVMQRGPNNRVTTKFQTNARTNSEIDQMKDTSGKIGFGTFTDGSPNIPYDEHSVLLHDWNHTKPYRRIDPLRMSLKDGRVDRSKWPSWPHNGRRTMSALPAVQNCKLRKATDIPKLKNGDDGVEEFLKDILEPACRLCKICRRKGGFRPSATNLFLCKTCNHHKSAHGRSKHPLSKKEAVRRIQNVWRAYSANLMITKLVKSIYEKHWDEERSSYFYFNKSTKESRWTKPILLGDYDVEPMSEPPIVQPLLMKVEDENTKQPLFTSSDYDTESDEEESIAKQKWLREVATAEERMEFSQAVEKRIERRKRRMYKKQQKAAKAIANVWRTYRARQDMTRLLRSIYEKVFNEKYGAFYWYNKNTGESSWTCPALLAKIGDVTPRFEYD